MFQPSEHAVRRYIERFEGNITDTVAATRLRRIVRKARFRRVLPGRARLYSSGPLNFVVQSGVIVTVYRLTWRAEPVTAWRA
ncbi:hypothetical protein GCM10010840_33820 [Deinococcus aerolatus]|uniref:Uncharacterized protein n=1 Tax=Deinococcus aerolatus TaxID=522487 RepID=A0ABQ2GFB3_9DEIO|nr:hypothetical protein [Deinococcus aerolatus]GGL92972.1 hypothetical protein GCM10010840_33820 [Deinococcus aerolatus]